MGRYFRGRVMKVKKRKEGKRGQEIPIMEVLMEEILTRLPAKSVMRFKSVSKDWSSLICSSYFNNRFLTVPSRPPRIGLYMSLVDLKNYRKSVTLSLSATNSSSSSSFVVDHDLTIPRLGASITQNLCGFMCYTFKKKPRIYNPTTRKLITLPVAIKSSKMVSAPGEGPRVVSYYFGHDPVNNQYKVVCSTSVRLIGLQEIRSEHKVFVLKRGGGGGRDRGCWRKATLTPDVLPHVPVKGGVCIDAVLYYMGWTYAHGFMLVSFDIRSRDFKMIQVPRRDGDERLIDLSNVSLIEYDGKLTMTDQTHLIDKGMLDLWILEDDAGNKKLTRKTLKLQPSQLHLVNNNNNNNTTFDVRGTTQNGKVFFIPQNLLSDPFHILSYDLKTNDMRKVEIRGVPDHWFIKDQSKLKVIVMDQNVSLQNLDTST